MPKAFLSLALVCVAAVSAAADTANFASENFRPSPHGDAFFSVESGAIDPSLEVRAGVFLDYEYRPLQLYLPSGKRLSGLLDHRLSATVLGSFTLFDRLSIGFLVPATLYETNDPKTAQSGVHAAERAAFGDLRLEPKIGILDQARHAIDLAVLLDLTLPTATRHSYAGDRSISAGGEIDLSRRFGAFRIAGNFGFQWRPKARSFDLEIGPELYYRFGGGFDLARLKHVAPVEIIAEIYGRTSAITPFKYGNQNPLEWVVGAKWSPLTWFALNLGGGRAINAGYGAPAARVFLGAIFTPVQSGAKQGELDTDGDGIPDRLDRCPNEAEDKDGFEDDDGCPDLDNDKDGIPDALDKCPNDPEDRDGFEDQDGCPDPDNDKDAVLDGDDQCPNTPGSPGGARPGCPGLIVVTAREIRITQQIQFDFNKSTIKPVSFPILDAVKDVLAANPKITLEVQGHTDNVGQAGYNLKLSQQRADAVRAYLTGHGIETARLVSKGFGMDQPILANDTEAHRALNRRVQFIRTESQAP